GPQGRRGRPPAAGGGVNLYGLPVSELVPRLKDASTGPGWADALAIAYLAHDGQKRDGGEPYLVHPIRVAVRTALAGGSPQAVSLALLHDVLEDCRDKALVGAAVKEADQGGYLPELRALTKRRGERIEDYAERVREAGRLAAMVKVEDRIDNIGDMRGW